MPNTFSTASNDLKSLLIILLKIRLLLQNFATQIIFETLNQLN